MKILFLTNQMNVGGVETNIVRLTRELTRRGHEVWAGARAGHLSGALEEAGGKHIALHMSTSPVAIVDDVSTLVRFVRKAEPHVVHVFSALTASLWSLVRLRSKLSSSRTPRLSTVSSIMGLQASPDEKMWVTRLKVFLTAIGADRLIVMAPAIDDVVQSLPVSKRRLVHMSVVGVEIPEDIDQIQSQRSVVRSELGVRQHEPMVLTIGNLEPRKSHEYFIRAAARVLRHAPDARFFIVGEGDLRRGLAQEIESLKLCDRVSLLGRRDDVLRLLAATDVYVRPGIVEGFIGITVLEAQALGVPVIAFDLEDVKLAVTDDISGRIVPRGQAEALADAILELVDDGEVAQRLGAGGRQQVLEHYSMPAIADRLEELYRDVIGEA